MKIDLLTENTIKMSLSKADAEKFGVRFDLIAAESSGQCAELRKLLDFIKHQVKTSSKGMFKRKLQGKLNKWTAGGNIVIEAFDRPDGDVLLYVSRVVEDRELATVERNEIDIIKFPKAAANIPDFTVAEITTRRDAVHAQRAVEYYYTKFSRENKQAFPKTQIFSLGGKYRILLNKKKSSADITDVLDVLKEYGELFHSEDEYYYTLEYGSVVTNG
ncbi:MAG: hypothetical protein LBN42_00105 [Oscillospiraceae bacterium]|jgi:negative regulator of genetic competence, sporulation and motility|nr:hypothetical protein [Oscillospiraceae bacterium]